MDGHCACQHVSIWLSNVEKCKSRSLRWIDFVNTVIGSLTIRIQMRYAFVFFFAFYTLFSQFSYFGCSCKAGGTTCKESKEKQIYMYLCLDFIVSQNFFNKIFILKFELNFV